MRKRGRARAEGGGEALGQAAAAVVEGRSIRNIWSQESVLVAATRGLEGGGERVEGGDDGGLRGWRGGDDGGYCPKDDMCDISEVLACGRRRGRWCHSGAWAAEEVVVVVVGSRRRVTPMVEENMPVANAAGAIRVPNVERRRWS